MKIGVINNLYKPYNVGGAEKVVENDIVDFKAKGHEVFLITSSQKEKGQTEKDGLKIYYLKSIFCRLKNIPLPLRFFWHLGNIFSFKKAGIIKNILKEEKPDLIVTHNLMGIGFLTPKIISSLKIEHHHFLHDIQLLHPSGLMFYGQEKKLETGAAKFYQFLTRKLFASPAKIISPSKWLLEEHLKRGFFKNSQTEIRPFNILSEQKVYTQKTGGKTNFLFVGQIEKHKGISLLISAFNEIDNPDIRLKIIGKGSELEKIKKEATGNYKIEILGYLETSDIRRIMSESDCLIVPSFCYENSPTTIQEANSVGLPVIASNIGGIPEIIKAGDKLFIPGNKADLINKINEFLIKN